MSGVERGSHLPQPAGHNVVVPEGWGRDGSVCFAPILAAGNQEGRRSHQCLAGGVGGKRTLFPEGRQDWRCRAAVTAAQYRLG